MRLVSHNMHKGVIGEEEFPEVSLTQRVHKGCIREEFSEVSLTQRTQGRRSSLRLVLHNVYTRVASGRSSPR